ncbi:DDE_3 domain-containing protein [Trichonephila clavipes]|nr:DDE_3 domain-containing protein [Trichonephila clavipes]
MGAEFLFMKDNAHPHRANIADECLQLEDITRMDWPAYSPDLNPIEHVSETVPHNQNRSIHAKRNHFPLKPTCSLAIHKSQGIWGFDEIVYKYREAQPLVYVVLSRVTSQEGLQIVPTDGRQRFTTADETTQTKQRWSNASNMK